MECTAKGCLRPVFAKTLCHKHYDEERTARMPKCTHDGCQNPQKTDELCNLHYRQKLQAAAKPCEVAGCGRPAQAFGLCNTHNRRRRLYGSLDPTRPEDWGAREKHPLYHSWKWILRSKTHEEICERWRADFWSFVIDVGDRPHKGQLIRINESLPYSKENVRWRQPEVTDEILKDKAARMSEYQKRLRENHPERYRAASFKRHYGITYEQYNEMLIAQRGVCAICEKPQAFVHPKTGEPVNLSVDHCHRTGKVRALLCSKCNTALGALDDNVDLLHKAIEYIERHAKE